MHLENHSPEEHSHYNIDIDTITSSNFTQYCFYFRSQNGALLAYIKFNYVQNRGIIYIIDLTSASGFSHMTDEMKQFYRKMGYIDGVHCKGFGHIALTETLSYIKKHFPHIKIIPVCSLETNIVPVHKLLERTKIAANSIIESIRGGGETSVATLFLI